MRAKEIREIADEQLQQRLKERQDDLMNFRMQLATGVVDNNRAAREARRDIARIKTVLREREIATAASAAKGVK